MRRRRAAARIATDIFCVTGQPYRMAVGIVRIHSGDEHGRTNAVDDAAGSGGRIFRVDEHIKRAEAQATDFDAGENERKEPPAASAAEARPHCPRRRRSRQALPRISPQALSIRRTKRRGPQTPAPAGRPGGLRRRKRRPRGSPCRHSAVRLRGGAPDLRRHTASRITAASPRLSSRFLP